MLPWAIAGVSLALAATAGALWLRVASTPTASQRLLLEIGPPFGRGAGHSIERRRGGGVARRLDGGVRHPHGAAGRRLYVRSLDDR